jgi:hypothetical protein
MTENKYLLSLSSSPDGDEVNLHADSEGLAILIEQLKSLKNALESDEAPHSHLMSESWGMNDLTESMLNSERKDGCRQVQHIKLYAWSKEWKTKHDL